jgi:hypothetical protein
VLWVDKVFLEAGVNIRSESLQELYMRTDHDSTHCIKVEAPVLKKMRMLFGYGAELSVSVVAPIVEKVLWQCTYRPSNKVNAGFSPWGLRIVS